MGFRHLRGYHMSDLIFMASTGVGAGGGDRSR